MKTSQNRPNKLIVIVGETASGKSDLAVALALKFGGEAISADSRQIYEGMDIGSGKITKKEMRGVKHYLLGIASPKRIFTVAHYQKLARETIAGIQKRGNIPILVGGTGFYIKAAVQGTVIPQVAPDWPLRKALSKLDPPRLVKILEKLDPESVKRVDSGNPRRLIRAIEIVKKTGRPVPAAAYDPLPYPVLTIGIAVKKTRLRKAIKNRLAKRLRLGMVSEVKKLHKSGLSWKKLESFGLEYRFCALYLQKKITKSEMINLIRLESERYAKRQLVWFKGDPTTLWIKNKTEAFKLAAAYLKK
jgi:tRNA dimethylallyltransferase